MAGISQITSIWHHRLITPWRKLFWPAMGLCATVSSPTYTTNLIGHGRRKPFLSSDNTGCWRSRLHALYVCPLMFSPFFGAKRLVGVDHCPRWLVRVLSTSLGVWSKKRPSFIYELPCSFGPIRPKAMHMASKEVSTCIKYSYVDPSLIGVVLCAS